MSQQGGPAGVDRVARQEDPHPGLSPQPLTEEGRVWGGEGAEPRLCVQLSSPGHVQMGVWAQLP